jgi:hypothetical protein
MKVHLFIQMCVLSSKIERYHLEFDSNWAISSNDFIQYIAKYSPQKNLYRFWAKNCSKKKDEHYFCGAFKGHGNSWGQEHDSLGSKAGFGLPIHISQPCGHCDPYLSTKAQQSIAKRLLHNNFDPTTQMQLPFGVVSDEDPLCYLAVANDLSLKKITKH